MRKRSWDEATFRAAVANSTTIADVLRGLNLSVSPGNYKTIHKYVAVWGVSTTHFLGQAHKKGRDHARLPTDAILVQDSFYAGSLAKRLLKEGLLIEQCAKCRQGPHWQGARLVLQLDHINGDPRDNRLENLRILCPNCHSQTETFGSRNSRRGRYKHPVVKPTCVECGTSVSRNNSRCMNCYQRVLASNTRWPDASSIAKAVQESSYAAVATSLGVTDTAVRKFLKRELGYAPSKYRRFSGPTG